MHGAPWLVLSVVWSAAVWFGLVLCGAWFDLVWCMVWSYVVHGVILCGAWCGESGLVWFDFV